jgi:threonine-phosphate decarboxylase
MIQLSDKEQSFYEKFLELKRQAGTHSPSIFKLLKDFPEVSIKIDACFLCNPYAFNLFYEELQKTDLQKYIKFYPPQNHEVAENLAAFRGIPAERILVGNGAIEIIETLLGGMVNQRVLMPIPTFSSYYESLGEHNHIMPYSLSYENGFAINVEDFIAQIHADRPDCVILVNPNNPTGALVNRADVIRIHKSLQQDQILLVDESFIDFTSEENSIEAYSLDYDNIVIVRSLSKDFGIAGLRLGYGVLPAEQVKRFLKSGFLWNSNGIAYYFTELLASKAFQRKYTKARNDYNAARDSFYEELLKMGLDVIPSQANFFMIRTPDDPGPYFVKLLYSYGIYTRILNDKWGLEGSYIRIASKDRRENRQMLHAIKQIWMNK